MPFDRRAVSVIFGSLTLYTNDPELGSNKGNYIQRTRRVYSLWGSGPQGGVFL